MPLKVNTIQTGDGLQSIGTERLIRGACAAWVNFNGTGTVAIRASYNVASITDNNTGDYTVNFTTAMPDANYSAVGTVGGTVGSAIFKANDESAPRSATQYRLVTLQATGTVIDVAQVSVAIFR